MRIFQESYSVVPVFQGFLDYFFQGLFRNFKEIQGSDHTVETFAPRYSIKKVLLKILQNLQENVPVSFFIKLHAGGQQIYKKETLPKVFSCEFCKIFKNTCYFVEYLWQAAASVDG